MILRASWLGAGVFAAITAGALGAAAPAARPQVAVVRTAAWSAGEPTRDGASELMVLLAIARARQVGEGGLVAVGDRRGLFNAGAEEALRQAVLAGIPVVKLAERGRVLPAPHGLFLDGGALSESEAGLTLARCLEKYGTLPAGRGGAVTAELRARLKLFQDELTMSASTRVALR
jgi:hypothetical protein